MCDEPTGALDVRTGMAVLEAIEQINRDLGTLTLIITHNSVMAGMADRVLTLSDGHITGEKRNAARAAATSLAW
jgi:putative ABC transport system ATP-binding protein